MSWSNWHKKKDLKKKNGHKKDRHKKGWQKKDANQKKQSTTSKANQAANFRPKRISQGAPWRPTGRLGHPNTKCLGEASEAAFVARAKGFNFSVGKLWGEADACDTVVGFLRKFWRVQVKCAYCCIRGQYVVKAGGDSHLYTKDDIDFIAAHIVPENIWYIVPVEAFQGKTMLHFNPRTRGGMYEKYREAWCLLAVEEKLRGRKDIPNKCRCPDLPIRCAACPKKL
jgi:hypothetical protein